MRASQPRRRQFLPTPDGQPFTVIDAFDKLFRQWFAGPSWNGWRSILRAAFCLPMTEAEIEFFRSVTGGSAIAAYTAAFFRAGTDRLRPGERAMVQLLACDRDQAGIVAGYIKSYFDFIPPLAQMVSRRTADGLELKNDVDIVVATNSFRAVRGRAVLVSIFDEVAFWQDERSARPDLETYNAVKPGLATLGRRPGYPSQATDNEERDGRQAGQAPRDAARQIRGRRGRLMAIYRGIGEDFRRGNPEQDRLDERKSRFNGLCEFVRAHHGWVTSVAGARQVTVDVLPGSALPATLERMGYKLRRELNGPRILPTAVTQEFVQNADGALAASEGSSRPVSMVTHSAGISPVEVWTFMLP